MAAMAATARKMTRNKRTGLLLGALLLALTAGCSKPDEGYALLSRQAAEADGGRYTFVLDLDEDGCTYETYVAARINTARLSGQTLELQFSVTSPTGETAIERVAFPLRDARGVRDFLWPWRDRIRVSGSGLGRWTVVITLPDPIARKAVEGIGLSYHQTKWEKAN